MRQFLPHFFPEYGHIPVFGDQFHFETSSLGICTGHGKDFLSDPMGTPSGYDRASRWGACWLPTILPIASIGFFAPLIDPY